MDFEMGCTSSAGSPKRTDFTRDEESRTGRDIRGVLFGGKLGEYKKPTVEIVENET